MLKCKECGIEYSIKPKNKCHDYGYCSYRCYRKTDEYMLKYKKTFIKNRSSGLNVNDLNICEINNLFYELKSKSVKLSQPTTSILYKCFFIF